MCSCGMQIACRDLNTIFAKIKWVQRLFTTTYTNEPGDRICDLHEQPAALLLTIILAVNHHTCIHFGIWYMLLTSRHCPWTD